MSETQRGMEGVVRLDGKLLRDISNALANARCALEYWKREALVRALSESWVNGPLKRGRQEIENLERVDAIVRPLAYRSGPND